MYEGDREAGLFVGSAVPFERCFFHVSRDAKVRGGVGALERMRDGP